MPIYEFICSECGIRFEKLLKYSAEAPPEEAVCPDCGAPARRVFSTFAMHGAGGGGGESLSEEAPSAPVTPQVTPKEDIDRWRKLSKKKS